MQNSAHEPLALAYKQHTTLHHTCIANGFSHCLQLSASFLRPFASGTALSGTANLHGDWHLGHAAW